MSKDMSEEMQQILNEVDLSNDFNKILSVLKVNNMAAYDYNKELDKAVFGLAINKKGHIVALRDPEWSHYTLQEINIKNGNLHIKDSYAGVILNEDIPWEKKNTPEMMLEKGEIVLIYDLERDNFSENISAAQESKEKIKRCLQDSKCPDEWVEAL